MENNKAQLYQATISVLERLIGLESTGEQEDAQLRQVLASLTQLRDSSQPIEVPEDTEVATEANPIETIAQPNPELFRGGIE